MWRGLAAFRWFAVVWAWVGVAVERDHLERPVLAVAGLAAATAVSAAWSFAVVQRRWLVTLELAVAAGLLLLDGTVYDAGREQSLPWALPSAAVIAVAIAHGLRWSLGTAALLAAMSFAGESILREEWQWSVSTASKSALLVLAAVSASAVATVLRDAEQRISTVQAREDMGRVLHDGVLQTLAVIQRRSSDPELVDLATGQERDLRAYLNAEMSRGGRADTAGQSLSETLRATVDRVARREGARVDVVVADDLPAVASSIAEELAAAVGEAVTNAAKHASASRIAIYAEPEGAGVYISVKDDGVGFDPDSVTRRGLDASIGSRVDALGGRWRVRSQPGNGTEVELWIP